MKRALFQTRAGLLFIVPAVLIVTIVAAFLLKKPSLDFDPFIGRALDPPVEIPPFSLLDHRGGKFSNTNLTGHWTLAFFGFTYCPDVCPTALNEIAAVYKEMGSMPGEGMAPEFVFFTVDPFRDTPEELGKYVGYFNTGFTGVTGKPAIISKLVADLGLYYAYTDPDDDQVLESVLQKPAMDYYGVIHSSRLLFISPRAELVAVMSPPFKFDNVMEFLNTLRKHHGD